MSKNPFLKKEDLEKIEADKKAALDARKLYLERVKWVLSTKQGRSFLWEILSRAGIYHDCFDPSGSITNLKLGNRQMGLRLLEDIEHADQEAYFQMRRENIKEKI